MSILAESLHDRRTENRKKVTVKRYNALLVNMVYITIILFFFSCCLLAYAVIKVFRYSFSETIPIFFIRLKFKVNLSFSGDRFEIFTAD